MIVICRQIVIISSSSSIMTVTCRGSWSNVSWHAGSPLSTMHLFFVYIFTCLQMEGILTILFSQYIFFSGGGIMILLVNLVFVALARSGHDHAVPVLDLLALHVGEYNLKQVTITFAHHYVGDKERTHAHFFKWALLVMGGRSFVHTCLLMQTSTGWGRETVTGLNTGSRTGSRVQVSWISSWQ